MPALALLTLACLFLAYLWRRAVQQSQRQTDELHTRLAQAEEALRGARDMVGEYEALLETSKTGILIIGRDGRIERANSAARAMLLGQDQPLVGRTPTEALLLPGVQEMLHSAKVGSATSVEVELPGSPQRVLTVSVAPIDAASSDGRILVILEDITQQRRLETARRDFVANVSHELRTPLASIRAMAETLRGGAVEDFSVAPRFLDTIVAETERLDRISRDLLILSRAETRAPTKTPVNLAEMIARVSRRFHRLAQTHSLLLETHIGAPLWVEADADQMEQVLVNLLDNAVKYTPAGGKVSVWAQQEGNQVLIRVADTGVGIMQKDLPRIFERFYRVDPARSRQTGGTGLGLAIVKHIVEAHGGHVWVKSEYRHGSEFGFALPALEGGPIQSTPHEEAASKKEMDE